MRWPALTLWPANARCILPAMRATIAVRTCGRELSLPFRLAVLPLLSLSPSAWAAADVATEDRETQSAAIQSYAVDNGVDSATATARIALQDRTAPLVSQLDSTLGESFGGAWYDPDNDGRLTVGVALGASTAPARALVEQQQLVNDVAFERVHHSWKELRDKQLTVDDQLRKAPVNRAYYYTWLDPSRNGLVLVMSSALPPSSRDGLRGMTAFALVPVFTETVTSSGPLQAQFANDCPLFYCDPPLRGSEWIASYDSAGTGVSQCTAGFTATSRTDGKPYLLTAGHCFRSWRPALGRWLTAREWVTSLSGSTERSIGFAHNSYNAIYGDAGISSVANDAYWRSKNWVRVFDYSGPTRYKPRAGTIST